MMLMETGISNFGLEDDTIIFPNSIIAYSLYFIKNENKKIITFPLNISYSQLNSFSPSHTHPKPQNSPFFQRQKPFPNQPIK